MPDPECYTMAQGKQAKSTSWHCQKAHSLGRKTCQFDWMLDPRQDGAYQCCDLLHHRALRPGGGPFED